MKSNSKSDAVINTIMVRGRKVTFHADDTFRIHVSTLEEARQIQKYMIDEGHFNIIDKKQETREGDEWKNG